MKCYDYDIVVLGCGAAGIGVAYALKDSMRSILFIDKLASIGGTHLNAWVNVHAATPAPPFLEPIVKDMLADGSAKYVNSDYKEILAEHVDYERTFLSADLIGEKENLCICFNIEKMRERYVKDLSNLKFMLNTTFDRVAECDNGKVKSILVYENSMPEIKVKISACVFIDCSADDVLIRSTEGGDKACVTGIDSRNRYLQSHGFIEEHNSNTANWPYVNDPTLMYSVTTGTEVQDKIDEFGPNDALVYKDPLEDIWYVNTINYLLEEGYRACAVEDREEMYNRLREKTARHWKKIKNGNAQRLQLFNLPDKKIMGNAPILGLRETYRALCERMLSEKDLYESVSLNVYKQRTNLDTIIAVGNHSIDIHSSSAVSNIDLSEINTHRTHYGVSYGSIVPLNLKNVLVASRGAGFTHIAAASFRLNKNMMQLGWAAGKAAMLFVGDFRYVDYEKLVDYIEIEKTIDIVDKLCRCKMS